MIKEFSIELSKILNNGAPKEIMESCTVIDLINALKLSEEKNAVVRTIHKSKGAEFESVLVYLDAPKDLKNIIHANINSDEDDTRLNYVALSRAKKLLVIMAPSVDNNVKKQLEDLGIQFWSKP